MQADMGLMNFISVGAKRIHEYQHTTYAKLTVPNIGFFESRT